MAKNKRDYYEVLGVNRDCSQVEIKQAYRKLARQFHPDVNNGNTEYEERFKEISEAYAVLSNEDKRRQYDTYGFSGNLFDGINFDSVFSEFGFGDIFNMFFGGGFGGGYSNSYSGSARREHGTDVYSEITIDFKEAAFGTKKEIEYSADVLCKQCNGSGAEKDEDVAKCSVCGGTGQVRTSRNTFLGSLITTSVCHNCGGKGRIVKKPCTKCGGKGYLKVKKKISVDIPSGVSDGVQLRLAHKGNSRGYGSVEGDLLISIKVKPHPFLKRDGDNVKTMLDISFAQAALGTKIEIETLDGNEEISVKPGTQPNSRIILKGKGIIPLNSNRRGDHIILINVNIPDDLNNEEIQLLKKYAEGRHEAVGDGASGILSNIKNAFKK
ncbi:MAG: molecular chaperone DnaJ [Actinobacteria bacterium]|nr:molecular chaperone DnaJ [Actinomycetota bacterium]